MLTRRAIDPLIERALQEDLASGDLTSEACVPVDARASAVAVAKQPLIACGGLVFKRAFELVDSDTKVDLCVADGDAIEDRSEMWRVFGRARSVLMAERVALNFTQRMCGIASLARKYVAALPDGARTRVSDTRKTTPGLRSLERYAVRVGGAHNHRDNLGSAVMIKDNHIVAAGSLRDAVINAQQYAPHSTRIEVEVATLEQFDEAVALGADIIMLDNMDNDQIREALSRVDRDQRLPIIEASGGITLERIGELATIGVDVISVGALTHSAPAADISLEFAIDG